MKALIMTDEINVFHWTLLKSVLLILSLLPMSQGLMTVIQTTEGGSQIMLGFFMLSIFSSLFLLSFCSAIQMSVLALSSSASKLEQKIVQMYRHVPLLFLAVMVSYLAYQI